MGAQISLDVGQEKFDAAETSSSLTANDVRVQIKSGTTKEQAMTALNKIMQYMTDTHAWVDR